MRRPLTLATYIFIWVEKELLLIGDKSCTISNGSASGFNVEDGNRGCLGVNVAAFIFKTEAAGLRTVEEGN